MPKFIEGFIESLQVPDGAREIQVFDDNLPGFGIRKFASGRASYFVKYTIGTQQRRHTLGPAIRGNLKAMRLEASRILARARLGDDVSAQKRAAAAKVENKLGELIPRYLSSRRDHLRPKSYTESKRYLEVLWRPLHGLAIDAIKRQSVVEIVTEIERERGKVSADRARVALSGLYGWAIDLGLAEANPTLHIRSRAGNIHRDRVLNEDELVEIWRSCGEDDFGSIVRLLILTGQRREEIAALTWSEINFERAQIELPAHRTKNGRPHIVPLAPEALGILNAVERSKVRDHVFGSGSGGFSGWSKSKARLDHAVRDLRRARIADREMPSWTIHDLRRSFITHVNEKGIASPHVAELIVNHVSGHRSGVAGVYNKAILIEERRSAMIVWAKHLFDLLQRPSPVANLSTQTAPYAAQTKTSDC